MNAASDVGTRFREARKSLGLSQEIMANRVSVNVRTWREYEAGNIFPGGQVFAELYTLGFNANWLVSGEGGMMRADGPDRVDGFDKELLRDVIQAFEEALALTEFQLSPDKKSHAILLLYEYYCDTGQIDSEQVARIIQLAA